MTICGAHPSSGKSHREKGDVNVGSSSGSPVRSSACRIAKRHERHQTPPPSCLQLWELVCRPRKFCPMQTKTLYQPTTSNTVFEGGTQPVGAPNSLGFQSPRIAYAQ